MRRFTRLTNGFSKKVENHAAAVAIHFMHYNFARSHKTPRQALPTDPRDGRGRGGSHLDASRDRGTHRIKLRHYPYPGSVSV